jgi:hypothetical protein
LGFPARIPCCQVHLVVPPAGIALSPLHLNIHGFGGRLEPRYIFGAGPLDQ